MIQPDAKCVVNGAKVNEAIMALNPLLAMSVGYIGGGKPPQVTYSDGEVKILLPLADSVDGFSLEELDIVDTNNAASSRYFMTSTDSVSTYGTTTASTSGTPTGKQSSAPPTSKDRNSLGNTPSNNNRDKLTTGGMPLDNSGVAPTGNVTGGSGMLKWDGNKVIEGSGSNLGGVDAFGNTIGGSGMLKWDGNKVVEGSGSNLSGVASDSRAGVNNAGFDTGGSGMLKWDGNKVIEGSGSNLGAADTTPPPLPGAPPQISDTTPPPLPGAPPPNQPATSTQADAAPVTQADDPVAKRWATYLESKEDLVHSLSRQLREAKKNDTQKWDASQNMWVFKKFGDPDSELVQALEARLEVAKAELKKAQSKA